MIFEKRILVKWRILTIKSVYTVDTIIRGVAVKWFVGEKNQYPFLKFEVNVNGIQSKSKTLTIY